MASLFVKALTFYFSILFTLAASGLHNLQKKHWHVISLTVNWNISNNELVTIDVRMELIKRGTYGLSGTFEWKFNFSGIEFMEFKSYRSATGSNQFKLLPFGIKNQSIDNFMATTYKTYLMNGLASCSNLPQAKGNEIPEIQIDKIYKLDKCQADTDNLPSHLPDGFYKVVIIYTGKVDAVAEALFKIEPTD